MTGAACGVMTDCQGGMFSVQNVPLQFDVCPWHVHYDLCKTSGSERDLNLVLQDMVECIDGQITV